MKTNHFFIPVFVTPEGEIFVNYSIHNKDGKVIFNRIEANKYYGKNTGIDWEIKMEVKEVTFNLQKDGLEIDEAPVDMVTIIRGISKNLKAQENYYFTVAKKSTSSMANENIVLMSLEDLLADENIDRAEKAAVEMFFNGDAITKFS